MESKMTLQEFIQKAKQVRDGISDKGISAYCDSNNAQVIKDAMIHSFDKAVEFNSETPFYFLETDDGKTIAYFGNGPTSAKNQDFFTFSANHWNTLLKIIELQGEALEFYEDGDNLCYEEKIQGKNILLAHGCLDDRAIECRESVQKLLEGLK